ncbi:helix-turn-helix domain-containing protein [Mesorhizobium sp.]|uniref:winged helix-turn-helix transcriptional regulator n=1 Tax=Mesorhizobium sp. TaxID=1871066 RepID=UPI000FE6BEC8|nr:helix-turn-helix domain-containing protein [Mesorhizobium sp.]RWO61842.1 MAG: transcriptional regulator [Mesorhizobium sp.]
MPTKTGPTKREPTKKLPTKRLPLLPAERALKVISGRWKAVILYHLFDGPRRLSALKTLVPDITQKVLIQQLREMEEHGLVRREIFAEIPSRVEYSATRLGLSLEPVLLALCEWGQHYADELNEMDRVTDCIIRPRQARPSAIA